MEKLSTNNLIIRDGVARGSDVGYILACDPKLEENNIPHTIFFKWCDGDLKSGSLNFDAHSICITSEPEFSLVMLASSGDYAVTTPQKKFAGNIFKGLPKRQKYGSFRLVTGIEGKAYSAGHGGMVYRLDKLTEWVRIDNGLPDDFKITSIDGFNADDIYAVGYKGEAWHFSGLHWSKVNLPVNINLTSVKCAGDGNVYIAGYDGVLLCGYSNEWDIIAKEETGGTIWDLEWFQDNLYISTMLFVYTLKNKKFELVVFDNDPPNSCYHLSTSKDVLWSIGSSDIASFDGRQWKRII